MKDIIFYDFEFNKKAILPPSSKEIGYTSMDATTEFCGDGSFELHFWDPELEDEIRSHPEGMLVKWGDFEGVITDYTFEEKEKAVYGMHLNSVLHKEIIPPMSETYSGSVEDFAIQTISDCFDWIIPDEASGGFESITFLRTDYYHGNSFIQELCARGHAGYRVYLDAVNKCLRFKLLKSKENPLMLSIKNKNFYEVKQDFSNKNAAYGGWYQQEQPEVDGETPEPIWTYITSGSTKPGLYKQDIKLSATTEEEALAELKEKIITDDISGLTQNLNFGEDYTLGDKVRLQHGGKTVQKTVISVEQYHENTEYNEIPTLGELKEAEESDEH